MTTPSQAFQLQHVRQEISRSVSFPEELASLVDEEKGRQLLDEAAGCQSRDELLAWTYSLSRKRLNHLFSAVLILSAATDRQVFTKLLTVFELRATVSLTQTAWAYYQRHYPNDRLGHVLKTLVAQLSDEDPPAFLQDLKAVPIDKLLPRRLAERLVEDPASLERSRLTRSDERVPVEKLREQFPLLAAYTDLSSVSFTSTLSVSFDTGLCGYMIRLALMPETPFAAAFMTAYFTHAADSELATNADLFIQALRISRPTSQVALLQRYLDRHRLSASWDVINQAIRDLFGVPSAQEAPITLASPQAADPVVAAAPPPPPAPAPPPPLPAALPATPVGRESWLKRLFSRKKQPPAAVIVPRDPEPIASPAKPQLPEIKPPEPAVDDRLADLIQAVREQLAAADGHKQTASIWKQVAVAEAARFRQWALLDTWRREAGDDPNKRRFFERYGLTLLATHYWDDQTLLADLGSFFLASHCDQMDLVWYYDPRTIAQLAQLPHDRPPLHRPQQPVITAREAMLDQLDSNIVKLPLDDINYLYAHDFLQKHLAPTGPVV